FAFVLFPGSAVNGMGHLWSLAVEEQFYCLWPLMILLVPYRHLARLLLTTLLTPAGDRDMSRARSAGRYHSRSAASTAPVRKLFCNFRSSGEGPPGSRLTWSCSGCFKELSASCFSRA